jgi:beta-glucosidase
LPEELDKRYGGLLCKEEFIADFVNFAKVMFDALGTKVKYWITFNEPWCSAILGYRNSMHAPGRSSNRTKSPKGDGTREPWIVGHNLLLAHANTVKLYREEYAAWCGGMIAITLNGGPSP